MRSQAKIEMPACRSANGTPDGGCVPIGNDVNVAAVVRAWNPRLTMPTPGIRDLRQWLGIASDDHGGIRGPAPRRAGADRLTLSGCLRRALGARPGCDSGQQRAAAGRCLLAHASIRIRHDAVLRAQRLCHPLQLLRLGDRRSVARHRRLLLGALRSPLSTLSADDACLRAGEPEARRVLDRAA